MTEQTSCEELLYQIKNPSGRDRGRSDPPMSIHSAVLPGPAPAGRLRRPWPSPMEICESQLHL